MMLSEHKGALALFGRLSARPGLPGHETTKKETGNRPLSPSENETVYLCVWNYRIPAGRAGVTPGPIGRPVSM